MKKLLIIPFPVLILFCLGSFSIAAQGLQQVQPSSVGMSSDRLARLTQTLQGYVDDELLSGGVALIARQGKVAYRHAFGELDMENGTPMQQDAIFRIASQTKAIVSVGIMILQEEGKLLINDPVGKYLPAFEKTTVAVPNGENGYAVVDAERPITIRDLLTHTAGIGYGGGMAEDLWEEADIQGWYFAHRNETIQATVNKMASLTFETQPGTEFVYGYNTDILGAVIEVVSGAPLNTFLQDRILDPLDMVDTHFYLPQEKTDRLAVVYSLTDGELTRAPDSGTMVSQGAYVKGPRMCFSGGAGYLSTAMDYARFLQMMLNGGALDGKRILSRKTVELMTANHLGSIEFPWEDGTGFGLGFAILDDLGALGVMGSEGLYGWGGAYHSTYWVDPEEELVVVYFTQLIPAEGIDDHEKLRALVYQAIVD